MEEGGEGVTHPSKDLAAASRRGEALPFLRDPTPLDALDDDLELVTPLTDSVSMRILKRAVLYREHPFLDTSRDGLAPRQPSSRHLGAIGSRGANNPNRASPTKPLFERARIVNGRSQCIIQCGSAA